MNTHQNFSSVHIHKNKSGLNSCLGLPYMEPSQQENHPASKVISPDCEKKRAFKWIFISVKIKKNSIGIRQYNQLET